jgi:putative membrane protein
MAAAPMSPSTSATIPPVPGANSFTEGEARNRIEASGYTHVTDLEKDSQSIWRGKAMKDGKPVDVSLDFKGNVVAE